ncbi:MAG TPA: hypothetical protein VFN35_22840, partial [Ktedonobacteraceae bacterium]|nr:hypothetical protein [Ktedonobacteraceae bacterium]
MFLELLGSLDLSGQSSDGGSFKERGQGEIDLEEVADLSHDAGSQQGVPSQLKEAVGGAQLLSGEQATPEVS